MIITTISANQVIYWIPTLCDMYRFSSVQLLSCVQVFVTPWNAAYQDFPSIINSRSLTNSCPLSQWCHPTILSSVVPFSSCLKSSPASGSFWMSQLFTSGSQSIWASASVPSMNCQGWFPLGLTALISLQSKELSRVFSSTTLQKHQFFALSLLYGPTVKSVHDYWKNITVTIQTFVSKVMSLLFNMLSRLVITFLPRSKCLLISWLQSPSTVIFEPKKIQSVTFSIVPPSICHEVMGLDDKIQFLECWVLSQIFHSPLSPLSRVSLIPLQFLP